MRTVERHPFDDQTPPVSIVVLAYNQIHYTRRCLESVLRHTPTSFELIVVDNASTDGTDRELWAMRRTWEATRNSGSGCRSFTIVRHSENLGFARGNNAGIALARGEQVILLNNDVVVTRGWLRRLTRAARSDRTLGVVGPMTNFSSGVQQVASIAYDPESLANLDAFADAWAYEHSGRLVRFWRVVGFCMLITREVIDRIGGLDTGFGTGNFEDDDYCVRAAIAGFRPGIAADCFVHHFGSRTFAGESIDRQAALERNWEIFKAKWRLPGGLPYGAPFDLAAIATEPYDAARHHCPLELPAPECLPSP